MPTIEYSLFRVKFIRPMQGSILHDSRSAKELFLASLEERPSGKSRERYIWHIGNLDLYPHSQGYFAIGRTTNATIEKYDEDSGDFVKEELETSPYTHCVFDANIGFVGIAKKSNLAPTAKGIAKRIEQLLSETESVRSNDVVVEITAIPDPEGFLKAIDSAFAVTSFTATFRGPNPFDADAYFQRPLSVYLNAANGRKGKAQIQGQDLDRQVVQTVARSTASTGNEASARIKKARSKKPITINLKGDPIKRNYDETEHDPKKVVQDLEAIYKKVRDNEGT